MRHIEKYSYGRDGKKRRQKPQIQQMIVAEYAKFFLTLNMELKNRSILIASFAGSRRRHRINHRAPTQSVCVADCHFIVNVLDSP